MVGKTHWTNEENDLLLNMIAQDLSPQAIFDSGRFPNRTVDALRMQVLRLTSNVKDIVHVVQPVKSAENALSIEEAIKRFSTAFKQLCELEEIDKFTLERFRLIFQSARDYAPLLAGYEKWDKIEKKIEELSAAVAEIQAEKGIKQA